MTVPDASGALLKQARRRSTDSKGIASVIEAPEFGKYGLPQPTATGQMGALLLTAKEGYAFTADVGDQPVVDAPPGSLGSHGYLASDPDLQALFIASGRGIKPRRHARLGVEPGSGADDRAAARSSDAGREGRVLTEMLSTPVSAPTRQRERHRVTAASSSPLSSLPTISKARPIRLPARSSRMPSAINS